MNSSGVSDVAVDVAYETVIGLEVHVELLTRSKLFCGCPNRFGGLPNTQTCPVCLGLPGSLPVLNQSAIDLLLRAALALDCKVPSFSKMDRKNYFYPDMPKNFQISQYDLPLAVGGHLDCTVDSRKVRVGITRIHLEEDTGKSLHMRTGSEGVVRIGDADYTVEDYNRAGVPLAEIVSEPDMRSPQEAYAYLTGLKEILTWIQVSDCKMEEGSLRCDANVSIRPVGTETFGAKIEVKNMNSFKSVQKALEHEVQRQERVLRSGGRLVQETRGWDEAREVTIGMRSKEEAHDYRYFPEPDLLPLRIGSEWLEQIRAAMPELPSALRERLVQQYGVPEYDASVLTSSRGFSSYFEAVARQYANGKEISNWLMGDFRRLLNEQNTTVETTVVAPEHLARMLSLVDEGVISKKIAKSVLEEMFRGGRAPDVVVEQKNLRQMSSESVSPLVDEVLAQNVNLVRDYLGGKEKAFMALVGQVMKKTQGKANPEFVNTLLKEKLQAMMSSGGPAGRVE